MLKSKSCKVYMCACAEENCCRHLNCVWLSECVSIAPKSTTHFRQQPVPRRQAATLRSTASPAVVERLAANDDTPERRHIFKPRYRSQQCIHNIYVYIGVYLNYIIPLRTCFCCCWYFCFMACHFKHCCCGNSSEQL